MSEEINQEQSSEDDWAAAMSEQADAEGQESTEEVADQVVAEKDQVEQAQMEALVDESAGKENGENVQLEAILDIPVTLAVQIGRTKINIRNLLQLNQGSVVELERLAGEPLDVLVNNTLVAHGEVVVVNEKYGIRLTDVISAHDRVKKLQ